MFHYPDLIEKHALQTPDRLAIHFEGREFTWAQLRDRTRGFAQALRNLGVAPGDRVAKIGFNAHYTLEQYFIPSMIGALSVPLNFRLAKAELLTVLRDCTPKVLITDADHLAMAREVFAELPEIEHLIFAGDDAPDDLPSYDDLIAQNAEVPEGSFADVASRTDDPMIIFYTSGTTGQPKGAMLTHSNLLTNSVGVSALYNLDRSDTMLMSGPLFHLGAGSRIFIAVLHGAPMIVQNKFEPAQTMQMIEDMRITTITVVPTMLGMMLDQPEFADRDLSSLRCLTYGAAPMTRGLQQRAMEALPGLTFCQAYGMTETSPVLTVLTPEDHIERPDKLGSVGRPVAWCDLRIRDAQGRDLPTGEIGEVVVRGSQVMPGYWQRPEESAEALRGGFYHSGDLGYLDEDGFLYLAGRAKEMIISGGENIYPIETENALSHHPAVSQCAVIGLPHPKWGEAVHAVVRLHDGQQASEADLIAHCRAEIAGYKIPKAITFWPESLPLQTTNKIDKLKLRALLIEGSDGA